MTREDAATIATWNANREAAEPLVARMLRGEILRKFRLPPKTVAKKHAENLPAEPVELHALLAMVDQVVALSPRVSEICPELPLEATAAAAKVVADGIRAGMAIVERAKAAPVEA